MTSAPAAGRREANDPEPEPEPPPPAGVGASGSLDPEEVLVRRLQAGDPRAAAELVGTYSRPLRQVARRLLSNGHATQDVVQDALAAAVVGIRGFRGESRLWPWLRRILVNEALMFHRARARRHEVSLDEYLTGVDSRGYRREIVAEAPERPEIQIERAEVRRRVEAAIAGLSATHRAVVLLRDIAELDAEEAAMVLGTTRIALKVRLHRARRALRDVLRVEEVQRSGVRRI